MWCRENLAQHGIHATADWTWCTPHKLESLILHIGSVFTCGAGAILPQGQASNDLFYSPASLSPFLSDASICFPTAIYEDKVWAISLWSPSDKLEISHFCRERLPELWLLGAILFFYYEIWLDHSWLYWPIFFFFCIYTWQILKFNFSVWMCANIHCTAAFVDFVA